MLTPGWGSLRQRTQGAALVRSVIANGDPVLCSVGWARSWHAAARMPRISGGDERLGF